MLDDSGQVLLLKRSDGRGWCLPGGWMDVHETPAEAAVREVREEAGIRVEPDVYAWPILQRASYGRASVAASALGIPAIRDRVAQTAVKLVIEPIFEADFEPNTHGYRPGRSAIDAIRQVHGLLASGYTLRSSARRAVWRAGSWTGKFWPSSRCG